MSASAGRVLIIPKGEYNSATTYNMLDMVYFGGKSYICKQTSTGNDPTNTVYWQIMIDGASEFSALSDVQLNNLQNGDGIYWDATAQKWKNTTPTSIAITSPPATTEYTDGDILDLTGMVVTANYVGGSTRNVTSECTFSPANGATLTPANSSVTVSWKGFTATQAISVSYPIYGVEWDGSSGQAWSRTDGSTNFTDPIPYYAGMSETPSSPFDNIMPWAGMEKVEDANAGTLVKIPKYWYKWTRNGTSMKLQIANTERTDVGWHVSPAHADRGDNQGERDFVYVGRYHCVSNYKSTTGSNPANNYAIAWFRNYIHYLGNDIWQYDYAMFWTIAMLYLVEFADWNSQAKIGRGQGNGSLTPNGATDSMPYHTGTTESTKTAYSHVQYRYIEDLWANVSDFVDGIHFDSSYKAYCIKNPASFDYTGGTEVGNIVDATGIIKAYTNPAVAGFEYALVPTEREQSSDGDIYVGDYCTGSTSSVMLRMGATYDLNSGFEQGLFMFIPIPLSNTSTKWGARLMKLPNS